jgi:hypothetical protein
MPAGPPERILLASNNREKNSGVVPDYGSLAVFFLMGLKGFDRATSIDKIYSAM